MSADLWEPKAPKNALKTNVIKR